MQTPYPDSMMEFYTTLLSDCSDRLCWAEPKDVLQLTLAQTSLDSWQIQILREFIWFILSSYCSKSIAQRLKLAKQSASGKSSFCISLGAYRECVPDIADHTTVYLDYHANLSQNRKRTGRVGWWGRRILIWTLVFSLNRRYGIERLQGLSCIHKGSSPVRISGCYEEAISTPL